MKVQNYFISRIQVEFAEDCGVGDTNKMQSLINQGANVNYLGRDGMRPLFWTLVKRNIKGFTFLLNHGANPNVVTGGNPPLESALTLAARMDNPEYLEELLKHGANPNGAVRNTRATAVFFAVQCYRTNNIAILLKHGADINRKASDGITPMQQAVDFGTFRTALFLYHAGANPLIKDKWGYNSIDTLRKFGDRGIIVSRPDEQAYKELIKELEAHGLLNESSKQ